MKKETMFYLCFIPLTGWKYYKCKAFKSSKDKEGTQYYTIEYVDELNKLQRLKMVPSRDLVYHSRTAWEYCFHFNDLGGYK